MIICEQQFGSTLMTLQPRPSEPERVAVLPRSGELDLSYIESHFLGRMILNELDATDSLSSEV